MACLLARHARGALGGQRGFFGPQHLRSLFTTDTSPDDGRPTLRPVVKPIASLSENYLVKGAKVVYADVKDKKVLHRRAHLVWDEGGPASVLIVKKPNCPLALAKLREIGAWLQGKGLRVLVERPVHAHDAQDAGFDCFLPDTSEVPDLCIVLGGDGTVLHLASLFSQDEPLPPLVSFAMGTLGFLTPFDVDTYQACLERVLRAVDEPLFCTLRTRKRCEVFWEGKLIRQHHVLNECLIDRGALPSLVTLDCFIDGCFITQVQADGLIIATPSGSTAYSMSAGGSMVAPSVPCTLLTPIAPHSLSFRPLVVTDSSCIEVCLPARARTHARASFDGRETVRLQRGAVIRCTTARCALPFINLSHLDRDWYEGIVQKLKWNVPIRPPGEQPVLPPH